MGYLSLEQRAEAQMQYGRDLRVVVVAMLAGTLGADQHRTVRFTFLPDPKFNFLQRAAPERFLDLFWVHGAESGPISLLDVGARVGSLRTAPSKALYWRSNQALCDKSFLGYREQDFSFARAYAGK